MALYHQKPAKRKSKISKILLDHQATMLRERIFVGQGSLQERVGALTGSRGRVEAPQAHWPPAKDRHRPAAGGFFAL